MVKNIDNTQVAPMTFKDLLRIIIRGKWLIILFTSVVFLIAFYKTFTTPPVYLANSTIIIEQKSQATTVFNLGGNYKSYNLATEIELLKSRSMAEAVVKKLWNSEYRNKLYVFGTRKFKPHGQRVRRLIEKITSLGKWSPLDDSPKQYDDPFNEEIGQRFAGQILGKLLVTQQEGTNILRIGMESVNSREAALLTNTAVHVYQDKDKERGTSTIKTLKSFILEQLKDKKQELNRVEDILRDFKEKELVFGLDAHSGLILSQLVNAESQHYSTIAEINIALKRKDYLNAQLSEEEKTLVEKLSNTINTRLAALRSEIGQKEAELVRNASIFGNSHEIVGEIQKDINALKKNLYGETQLLISQGISVTDPLQYSQNLIEKVLLLDAEIAGLKARSNECKKLAAIYSSQLEQLPQKQLNFARLERDRSVLDNTYQFMRQKLEETLISEASEPGKVRIIDPALAGHKVSPNIPKSLLKGFLLGLGLGIGFVFFKNYLDNTIRAVEDIERFGQTILGVIPRIPGKEYGKNSEKNKRNEENIAKENVISNIEYPDIKIKYKTCKHFSADGLITYKKPKSPISESFRSIRTNIAFSSSDKLIKSILITSPGPGEGKTTMVANLAVTFANFGRRTLMVDTDLRRPKLYKIFGAPRDPGITHYLIGQERDFNSLIYKTHINNLYLVPSGRIPPNPSELLGSQRMLELVAQLEQEWDIILFDSSPIVAVTDATMISKEIDKVILIVKSEETDKSAFTRAIQLLQSISVPLGGVVLNSLKAIKSYDSYYYYYQYYYYSDDGEKKHKKKSRKRVLRKIFS